ncbi:hypothetical protein ACTWJ8_39930 (plasmid) [Streptomyces sp. SDT5-1]|uniref:hypothetical protein n=1 Tax=Streptomyces sp. SDT5-1 TaxID=3406418 RepID=UPI003FD4B312
MSSRSGRDYFQFLAFTWDITSALEAAEPLPVQPLPTEPFFSFLPLIRVDREHAAHTDLTAPVLVATVAELDNTTMLIDGWHRLHRALQEGLTHLPCRHLTAEQELQVRLRGGSKKPHRRRSPAPRL